MYGEPKNSPFVPNIQKDIIAEREGPKPYIPQQYQQQPTKPQNSQFNKPIVDLQVYQPPKPRPQNLKDKDAINPAMYMPISTQNPYFPPQYNPYWPHYYNPQLVSPVIKTYNINTGGPFDNHAKLSAIYEDILPTKQFVNTSNTIGERVNMHNFVRSVFIKYHDGEDIDLDGKGKSGLLNYLKFLELNPYNTNQFDSNPYKSLPDDMLIYRSCYPIRYDDKSNTIQCAPNSIGMNIRIYKLSHAEYNLKKLQQANFYDYDLWREIAYYEYIREQVLKRNVCPNFTLLYAYYICEKCNIDFDKLSAIKGKQKMKIPKFSIPQNTQSTVPQNTQPIMPQQTTTIGLNTIIKQQIQNNPNPIVTQNLDSFSGRGLVALTEAPTYNIYGWSSRTYKAEGNINRMVNTGYHKSEIWMSILFQLMVGLYVLQLHKIAFNGFSLEDNVYIKDITQHDNVTTFWKYKIHGFEFYVPNHGYLLMIDTNYKDIEKNGFTVAKNKSSNNHKIYSNIFNDNAYDDTQLHNMCFNSFINAFNPNAFSNSFTNYGGTPPPEDIKTLIGKIHTEATNKNANTDIGYYISRYMTKLLNNRLGTYLSEIESKNVRKDDGTQFQRGQMVVHEIQNETYKFAIYIEENNTSANILTKQDPKSNDIEILTVSKDLLWNYSKQDAIIQNYKPTESNLNEDELLEVYVIEK